MAIYMKLGEAMGDVDDANHPKWIECLDARWDMQRSIRPAIGTGQNRESTSAFVNEFEVTKQLDRASHTITNYAFTGEANPAIIHFTRVGAQGSEVYRAIILQDAVVSSLVNMGHDQDRPSETIRLNFTHIQIIDSASGGKLTDSGQSVVSYDLTTGVVT